MSIPPTELVHPSDEERRRNPAGWFKDAQPLQTHFPLWSSSPVHANMKMSRQTIGDPVQRRRKKGNLVNTIASSASSHSHPHPKQSVQANPGPPATILYPVSSMILFPLLSSPSLCGPFQNLLLLEWDKLSACPRPRGPWLQHQSRS